MRCCAIRSGVFRGCKQTGGIVEHSLGSCAFGRCFGCSLVVGVGHDAVFEDVTLLVGCCCRKEYRVVERKVGVVTNLPSADRPVVEAHSLESRVARPFRDDRNPVIGDLEPEAVDHPGTRSVRVGRIDNDGFNLSVGHLGPHLVIRVPVDQEVPQDVRVVR